MAYDNGGRHSTLELAFDSADKLLRQGVPSRKICLGIPFYGRPSEGKFGDATTYAEIAGQHKLKPIDDEAAGLYFNGPETVARKVRLARRLKLGGVMIWEIGQDTTDAERSLLRAIREAAQEK
jgi:GH18 family chitinase